MRLPGAPVKCAAALLGPRAELPLGPRASGCPALVCSGFGKRRCPFYLRATGQRARLEGFAIGGQAGARGARRRRRGPSRGHRGPPATLRDLLHETSTRAAPAPRACSPLAVRASELTPGAAAYEGRGAGRAIARTLAAITRGRALDSGNPHLRHRRGASASARIGWQINLLIRPRGYTTVVRV